ncbi:MAG: ATP-binding cassette domain-containing protein [Minisyncoccia bacterium]|jgi:ATPase subunit of ABC transporter with duplicated ATPase domains
MPKDEVILRFNKVSFAYGRKKILDEVVFSVRRGMKLTLMGQNGAGKSTIFQMITGELQPEDGTIIMEKGLSIAVGKQAIPRGDLGLTVREFFENAFPGKKMYDIEPRIKKILDVVHLSAPLMKKLNEFSGGQQARLLLAQALIQDSDLLLLDEPTNNLDKQGIEHLTQFLIDYKKTLVVISHDAGFLNSFTHGVLYLDMFTKKVEQYVGDYLNVVVEITARLERERMLNARLARDIQNRKDQANFFAQKGGHMRDVARKMNEKIAQLEGDVVELRQEDRTIRNFVIPCQEDLEGRILTLSSISVVKNHKLTVKKVSVTLKKKEKLLLAGPNGIGKTTLLGALASGHMKGEEIQKGVRIGYYRQDFSTLDFERTVYEELADAARRGTEEDMRSVAAGFLLDAEILKTRIGLLSEGQKGLVAFAKLVLERPGLLLLDEPTNHINFRHIPVIAKALDRYEGALILVSHVPEFVKQIKIDRILDLDTL